MQKNSRPSFKLYSFLRRLIIFPSLFLVIFFAILYLTAPLYLFKEPKPFEGNYIHNPYQQVSSDNFYSLLFATPMVSVGAIFNGIHKSETEKIRNRISGFNHVEVVLRQMLFQKERINNDLQTYQHGLGLDEPTMICIGAERKLWIDYPLFKNIHHKQGLIEKLSKDSDLVVLNPSSFLREDLKYLSGYHLIDLKNNTQYATMMWDSVLSNGHLVYGFVSEEIQDDEVTDDSNLGFMVVNALSIKNMDLIDAISLGCSYSVISKRDTSIYESAAMVKPFEVNAFLQDDSIHIKTLDSASLFKFIGQNGKLLHFVENTSNASCAFRAEDTYIRTEILLPDGSKIYLNPFTRHSSDNADKQILAKMDAEKTAMLRGAYIILIVILLQIIFKWQMRKLKHKESNGRLQ